MAEKESSIDILIEKAKTLEREQLEKARSNPQKAHELYVTGLYPEVEEFYYPYKLSAGILKRESRN